MASDRQMVYILRSVACPVRYYRSSSVATRPSSARQSGSRRNSRSVPCSHVVMRQHPNALPWDVPVLLLEKFADEADRSILSWPSRQMQDDSTDRAHDADADRKDGLPEPRRVGVSQGDGIGRRRGTLLAHLPSLTNERSSRA
jgi:hypothetical protein